MTKTETIDKCKALAMDNYENGMDAIIECWDEADWHTLYVKNDGSFPKMKAEMVEDAEGWIEGNLNARWGEDSDDCLSMGSGKY